MKPNFLVRRWCEADMPALEAAERFNTDGWDTDRWLETARSRTVDAWAVVDGYRVPVGFALSRRKPDRIVLVRVVTRPDVRQQGVGRAVVERLRLKLGEFGRNRLVCWSGVENVGTNEFLKAVGFTAVKVVEDDIRFVAGPLDYVPQTVYSDSFAGGLYLD